MTFGPKEYFVPGRIYEFGGFNHDYSFYRRLGREPREYLLMEGSKQRHIPKLRGKYLLISCANKDIRKSSKSTETVSINVLKFLSPDGVVVLDSFNRFTRRQMERWDAVGVLDEESFIRKAVDCDAVSLLPGKLYRWRLDNTDEYGTNQWSSSLEKENAKGHMVRHWPEPADVYLCTKIEWISLDDERSYHKGYYWKFSFLSPEGQVVVDEIHKIEYAFFRWELV